jgi:hypothetical protein
MLVPLFLWALNPSKPSIGDDVGTDPLGGKRQFLLEAPIAQDQQRAYLISQDQLDPTKPFSIDSGGSIGAPLSAFYADADKIHSHALAWGRDDKGDYVIEARAFHGKSSSTKGGSISLAVTYVGETSPAYTLQSFDACTPPAKTDDDRVEKSRCVDIAALDIDGDGFRDFVIVYGNTSSTGMLRAVAVNGNMKANPGKTLSSWRFVTPWTSSDGTAHLVPNVRAAAGNFLGDGTPTAAWLAAEQNDAEQPTQKDGSYVLWVCSFGKDFFTNSASTPLLTKQKLPQGFQGVHD